MRSGTDSSDDDVRDEVTIYPAKLVRTLDPAFPTVEAVATVGDRVLATGAVRELSGYPNSVVDDRYSDAVLIPGFVEAHTHLASGAVWRYVYVGAVSRMGPDGRVWPGCRTRSEIVDRLVAAEAGLDDPDTPLQAWGYDSIFLRAEGGLTRRDLDRVSTTRQVVVVFQTFHGGVANSAALSRYGVTAGCDVEGVVKDATGEPTGELVEGAAMALVPTIAELRRLGADPDALRLFGADAVNHGVTTASDLNNKRLFQDSTVELLRSVVDDPGFPVRLAIFHMGVTMPWDGDPTRDIERIRCLVARNSAKLRFGYIKLGIDGTLPAGTARLRSPGYRDLRQQGGWAMPPDQFRRAFEAYHAAGFTIHVHCNGDEATDVVLDSMEGALAGYPRPDHRQTVTHSQCATPAQYRRMAKLGMCASLFSNEIWYWGDELHDSVLVPERALRLNAAATALRSGVPISLHCDAPVTPLDPLATMSYACHRMTPSGRVLGEGERITVSQALEAMTLGAAYMLKMDGEVGSIEVGKYADFAVLSEDPCAIRPEELTGIDVRGTVVGGRHFVSEKAAQRGH